jgi:hypothetical protein
MAYFRNAWYVAAWSCDLEVCKPLALCILGESLVIYRTPSGKLVALEVTLYNRLVESLAAGELTGPDERAATAEVPA